MASSSANLLTYKNIIDKFFQQPGDREHLISERTDRINNGVQFVLESIPNPELSQKLIDIIRSKVGSMEITFFKKWRESKSKWKEEFERTFEKWVNLQLLLPASIMSVDSRMRGSTQEKKDFGELSERQKERRVKEVEGLDVDQLLRAAKKAAKREKRNDLAYVIKLLYIDDGSATEIRSLLANSKKYKFKGQANSSSK